MGTDESVRFWQADPQPSLGSKNCDWPVLGVEQTLAESPQKKDEFPIAVIAHEKVIRPLRALWGHWRFLTLIRNPHKIAAQQHAAMLSITNPWQPLYFCKNKVILRDENIVSHEL